MLSFMSVSANGSPEEIYRLGEIIVSASAPEVETVGTVHTITAQEIRQMGARSLDEALTLVPGLSIRTANDGTPRVDLRGFRTRHVQLLLDGIPVNSTFDGQFDPSIFGVENIAEIKVTTGAASVLYGDGGNGGVINIITKKGRKGFHGSVGAEAAEGDAYLGRFSLGGATEKVDVFVSGSVFDQDGYRLSEHFSATKDENGGERANSDRERQNLFANLGWSPSSNTQLGLTFNYHNGEFGIPPVTNYDANDPFAQRPRYDRVDDIEGYAIQLAFDQKLPGPFSTRGWLFFNQLDMLENRYDDKSYSSQAARGAYRSDSTTDIAGINLQFKVDGEKYGSATLALMANNHNWEADGFNIVEVGGGGGGGGGGKATLEKDTFDLQRDLQHYSAALEYEISLFHKLGLVLGYGHHFQKRDDNSNDDDFSYVIGAHYDLFKTTRLRANHARKIRFPSIRQLYEVDSGNEDLKTERSLHYEVGIDQQLPVSTLLSLTGFLIDAEDFIEKPDNSSRFENYEKYRFKGFEIALENRAVKSLLLRTAYSYLDSEDRSSNSDKDELQYRPRDKFTVEASYLFPFGLTASGSLLYVNNQYLYDRDNVPPLEKKRLDDYAVVNFRLGQSLLNNSLEIYGGVNNLFDEDYEESYGLPRPGRTFYAGTEYRF